jgi:hypothetical protein
MRTSSIPTSNLDFVNAISHPNNQVVLSSIVSPNSLSKRKGSESNRVWGVKGILTQDFNLNNNGTGWSSLFGESAIASYLSSIYNKGAAALDVIAGVDAPQTTLKSILQTQLNYTGTKPFELVLPMMFVALTKYDIENNTVLKSIRDIKEAEYPNMPELANTNFRIEAPLGYHAGDVTKAGGQYGAIDVKVGQYFKTRRRIMLIASSQFAISKEKVSNGSPLYAIGSVSLVASRIISSKEMTSYFVMN